MLCIDKEWNDCDFSGTIKKYNNEPKSIQEPVEIMDDYDVRHEFGSRVTTTRSRFDKEEV